MSGAEIGVVILAGGLSSRFENGNKLLSPLGDVPLAQHIIRTVQSLGFDYVVAVTPGGQPALKSLFRSNGIAVIVNEDPARGQGSSIAAGAAALPRGQLNAILVVLADMPFISAQHLADMIDHLPGNEAVMSDVGGVIQPPVLFASSVFPDLLSLRGDKAGRALIGQLTRFASRRLSADEAMDIDTVSALDAAGQRLK